MKSETLQLANMGLEDFKAAFNRMQQDPQDGQAVPIVQAPKGPLLAGLFGQPTVTELFEGVRTITYQVREKRNRQLIATVDVKRIHLEGVPLHPDRLNGLKVRIGWTEPALSFVRRVLLWLDRHFDVELPTWLTVKDSEEKEEETKGESLFAKGANEKRREAVTQSAQDGQTRRTLAHNSRT